MNTDTSTPIDAARLLEGTAAGPYTVQTSAMDEMLICSRPSPIAPEGARIASVDPGNPDMQRNTASLMAAAPALAKRVVALEEAISSFLADLKGIGFGNEYPLSEADTVDVICYHWNSLCAAIARAKGE